MTPPSPAPRVAALVAAGLAGVALTAAPSGARADGGPPSGAATPGAPAPAPADAPPPPGLPELLPDEELCFSVEELAGQAPPAAAPDCDDPAPVRPRARPRRAPKPEPEAPKRRRPKREAKPSAPSAGPRVDPALRADLLPDVPFGVPDLFIDRFRIPPFLLPIYQAAGTQYGIRWEVLAAINEIETDYGRNLNVSSAGAQGWMQFMPATWTAYGVDANRDGRKDPYSPVDAIFAAARYLKAAGAGDDLGGAIFAYNHADWYVESVLRRTRLIAGLPAGLVGSLSGLTQGRVPVGGPRVRTYGSRRTHVNLFAPAGAPVVAVQDGRIEAVGIRPRLGRFVRLRDVHGNTHTYGRLRRVAARVAVPIERAREPDPEPTAGLRPIADPEPLLAATAGRQLAGPPAPSPDAAQPAPVPARLSPDAAQPSPSTAEPPRPVVKERLFAHPDRPRSLRAGGAQQIRETTTHLGREELRRYLHDVPGLRRIDVELKSLAKGRRLIAGTILGQVGRVASQPNTPTATHLRYEIRPAGRDAPRIDPGPILEGARLLRATALHRSSDASPRRRPLSGEILLMDKDELGRRVLADPGIDLYACGGLDIRAGAVDRRVLATLAFLSASGLRPTVSSLRCGHDRFTSSGSVSAHATGAAVDISKINGIPILGNQGAGSITDRTVRRLLALQGPTQPAQIITLMDYEDAANTLAMADHADHIHIGFGAGGPAVDTPLRSTQWNRLMRRLGRIESPTVRPAAR